MSVLVMKDGTRVDRVQGGEYDNAVNLMIGSLTLEEAKRIFGDPSKTETMVNQLNNGKTETYTGYTKLFQAYARPDRRIKIIMVGDENNGAD